MARGSILRGIPNTKRLPEIAGIVLSAAVLFLSAEAHHRRPACTTTIIQYRGQHDNRDRFMLWYFAPR